MTDSSSWYTIREHMFAPALPASAIYKGNGRTVHFSFRNGG